MQRLQYAVLIGTLLGFGCSSGQGSQPDGIRGSDNGGSFVVTQFRKAALGVPAILTLPANLPVSTASERAAISELVQAGINAYATIPSALPSGRFQDSTGAPLTVAGGKFLDGQGAPVDSVVVLDTQQSAWTIVLDEQVFLARFAANAPVMAVVTHEVWRLAFFSGKIARNDTENTVTEHLVIPPTLEFNPTPPGSQPEKLSVNCLRADDSNAQAGPEPDGVYSAYVEYPKSANGDIPYAAGFSMNCTFAPDATHLVACAATGLPGETADGRIVTFTLEDVSKSDGTTQIVTRYYLINHGVIDANATIGPTFTPDQCSIQEEDAPIVPVPVPSDPSTIPDATAHGVALSAQNLAFWGSDMSADNTASDHGAVFDLATGTWTAINSLNSPTPRDEQIEIAIGGQMLVWGGDKAADISQGLNDGAIYDSATDTWKAMSTAGAPTARIFAGAATVGSKVYIWGGQGDQRTNPKYQLFGDGASYDITADNWAQMSTVGAPSARRGVAMVAVASKIFVWGGDTQTPTNLADGALYDPASDSWTSLPTSGAPSPRTSSIAMAYQNNVIIWGGDLGNVGAIDYGAIYHLATNSWQPMSTVGAPPIRDNAAVTMVGDRLLIWGGGQNPELGDGYLYDPAKDSWSKMASVGAPTPRKGARAVAVGNDVVIWGGSVLVTEPSQIPGDPMPNVYDKYLQNGGIYHADSDSWSPLPLGKN